MDTWMLDDTPNGRLRILPDVRRDFGSKRFTWGHLLYGRLNPVKVFVIYFPSRFDLKLDEIAEDAMRTFGRNTGSSTSVNFWDPEDPRFSDALALFDLKAPPALVFATGLELHDIEPSGPDRSNLYAITITDPEVLSDEDRLSRSSNEIHEILTRGNPKEIASYIRKGAIASLLEVIAKVLGTLVDGFSRLKPKLHLPDGTSISLGG